MTGPQKPSYLPLLIKMACVVLSLLLLYGSYKYIVIEDTTSYSNEPISGNLPAVDVNLQVAPPAKNNSSQQEKNSTTRALAGFFEIETVSNPLYSGFTTAQAQKLLFTFLKTFKASCKNPKRFGKSGDGGYWVCMDEKVAPVKDNCLVYSFGIRDEWSFDDAMHDQLGCEVHSFDPSMIQEDHQRKPKLFFHKLGIWDRVHTNKEGWKLLGLQDIRETLNHTHRTIDYMKIDVEGAEWPMLKEMLAKHSSKNVKQMIFEIHTPKFKGDPMTVTDLGTLHHGLNALHEELGFKLWSEKHVNGCCGRFSALTSSSITRGQTLCCYELFYINNDYL